MILQGLFVLYLVFSLFGIGYALALQTMLEMEGVATLTQVLFIVSATTNFIAALFAILHLRGGGEWRVLLRKAMA